MLPSVTSVLPLLPPLPLLLLLLLPCSPRAWPCPQNLPNKLFCDFDGGQNVPRYVLSGKTSEVALLPQIYLPVERALVNMTVWGEENQRLPRAVFRRLRLENFSLIRAPKQVLEKDSLQDSQGTLLHLEMMFSAVENLPLEAALLSFPELRVLSFVQCGLKKLPPLVYHGSLETLDLEGNHLESIPAGEFLPLPALKKLILSNNLLLKIGPFQLALSSPQVELFLEGNLISKVAPKAFSGGLPSSVKLSRNCLRTLDQDAFEEVVKNLKGDFALDITDNPLKCTSLYWLSPYKEKVATDCVLDEPVNKADPGGDSTLTPGTLRAPSSEEAASSWGPSGERQLGCQ